ncbi:GntR family transcriptional regulator [Rhizobium sp. Root274]|uniref:LacI family DNA-binding transcriptional regulator n=1 Tax=unclassified Rhizobium TaxID=2613769 RepID=UPI000715BC8D|nr:MULTISPECIES: LacI family DNA-binding transcriptional regulator [unclassified Rhizobium]KQW31316.1 GntR family transcriptional regulator [Rhizobium sp. Root1240]KRD32861.1 GntR family transcriptional regulator [Rhizobium sp. Root274]
MIPSTKRRRHRQEKVTLSDVALAAGVSAITVSRALRDPEKVSPALRETILRVVEQMGYVPDMAARALASKDSGLIGVLTPGLTSYAFIAVMRGIEDRVRATDLRIQYANPGNDGEDDARKLRFFFSQNPAGIIYVGRHHDPALDDLLKRAPCPVVEIMDVSRTPAEMAVGIDHRMAAEAATRHLINEGYRRIGLLGGGWDSRSLRRLEGYKAVMEAEGLFDQALVLSIDSYTSVGLGAHLLERLLSACPDADAAFCHSDDLALGALFECQRKGLRIPQDFGICGFNDFDYAGVAYPSLTSVRLPRYEIGYRAADMLIRATGGGRQPPTLVDLGFQLIPRQSTARIAAQQPSGAPA